MQSVVPVSPSDHCASVVHGKTLSWPLQTFRPTVLYPPRFTATIGFYHHMPLSLTLALAEPQGQRKAKPIGLVSYTFQLIWMKADLALKQLNLKIPAQFDSSLSDPDLDSRSLESRKQNLLYRLSCKVVGRLSWNSVCC